MAGSVLEDVADGLVGMEAMDAGWSVIQDIEHAGMYLYAIPTAILIYLQSFITSVKLIVVFRNVCQIHFPFLGVTVPYLSPSYESIGKSASSPLITFLVDRLEPSASQLEGINHVTSRLPIVPISFPFSLPYLLSLSRLMKSVHPLSFLTFFFLKKSKNANTIGTTQGDNETSYPHPRTPLLVFRFLLLSSSPSPSDVRVREYVRVGLRVCPRAWPVKQLVYTSASTHWAR